MLCMAGHGLHDEHSLVIPCIMCLQASVGGMNVAQLCEGAANQLYMLAHCQGCIHVVLATSCMPADVLHAFVHARVLSIMATDDRGSDQVIWLTDACACSAALSLLHMAAFVAHHCLRVSAVPCQKAYRLQLLASCSLSWCSLPGCICGLRICTPTLELW